MGNIKCLMFVGFILSVLGLVGQLLTPLFIGWVTDAIVAKNFEYVNVCNRVNISSASSPSSQSFSFIVNYYSGILRRYSKEAEI